MTPAFHWDSSLVAKMCKRNRASVLKLIVDNSRKSPPDERSIEDSIEKYWQAVYDLDRLTGKHASPNATPVPDVDTILDREDAALRSLMPLRTCSPRYLAQKVDILEKMAATERSPEQLAEFAASIASDALAMSRNYLERSA